MRLGKPQPPQGQGTLTVSAIAAFLALLLFPGGNDPLHSGSGGLPRQDPPNPRLGQWQCSPGMHEHRHGRKDGRQLMPNHSGHRVPRDAVLLLTPWSHPAFSSP